MLVFGVAGAFIFYGWGVIELLFDQELLKFGKLVVKFCFGFIFDGVVFWVFEVDV